MEQNDNEKKELVKTGAKLAAKAVMAPVKTLILTTLGTILPYILIGILVFIVILCVYFGTLEQIDEVLDGSTDWGERIGNAVSLYGFRTNEDLKKDEEGKFFNMLNLYKTVFHFDNYELSMLTQTLLYEGSNEERIYLSEYLPNYDEEKTETIDNDKIDSGGFSIWAFIKSIVTNYQRGFLSTFAGQSQYLKPNKNLLVNAAVLFKCSSITGGSRSKEIQCYKGYLVAEYNIVTDYKIDQGDIETDVEEGFLVLPNNIFGAAVGTINELDDKLENIAVAISQLTIYGKLVSDFISFQNNMRYALTLGVLGKLARADDIHFYYDGYIVQNLKEYYKVNRNDEYDDEDGKSFEEVLPFYDRDIVLKERKNRRETADDILDTVEAYYDLTYGINREKETENFDIVTSEKNSMVTVKINGEDVSISFEDYVSLILLQKYGDGIFDKDKAVLEAAIVQARTDAYKNATVNGSSLNYTDNRDFSEAYEIYSNLTSKQKSDLENSLSNTTGKVIKDANGNLDSNFDLNIEVDVASGKTYEDVIKDQGGNVENKNITASPFPTIDVLPLSSLYEGRINPITGKIEHHNGVDIALGSGTNIYAVTSGKVVAIKNSCIDKGSLGCGAEHYGGYGNIAMVESEINGKKYYILYAHMLNGSVGVNVGDIVEVGQPIGQVGSSGQSSGYHLHLEVRTNEQFGSTIDPVEFFNLQYTFVG